MVLFAVRSCNSGVDGGNVKLILMFGLLAMSWFAVEYILEIMPLLEQLVLLQKIFLIIILHMVILASQLD